MHILTRLKEPGSSGAGASPSAGQLATDPIPQRGFSTPARAALIGAAIFLAACTRRSALDQAPEVRAELRVEPDPALIGQARLLFQLESPDGEPLDGASLSLRADMTHPGMIPVLGEIEPQGSGGYAIPLAWTMAGDWVVTISGDLPDGRHLLRRFNVSVEPGPP